MLADAVPSDHARTCEENLTNSPKMVARPLLIRAHTQTYRLTGSSPTAQEQQKSQVQVACRRQSVAAHNLIQDYTRVSEDSTFLQDHGQSKEQP